MTDTKEDMEKAKCPYCGEEFFAEDAMQAEIKEGKHRAEAHVNDSGEASSSSGKGKNIVDKWKVEGQKA